MTTRSQLLALPVPWMISPSVSGIVVRTIENDNTEVEVDAEMLEGTARIAIVFRSGQWVRMAPADSDASTLPEAKFDHAQIPASKIALTASYPRDFRELWVQLGSCPDPGFYEVKESPWLTEANAARFGCRHFVVCGRDMWLEVLALDYSWSVTNKAASPSISVADVDTGTRH